MLPADGINRRRSVQSTQTQAPESGSPRRASARQKANAAPRDQADAGHLAKGSAGRSAASVGESAVARALPKPAGRGVQASKPRSSGGPAGPSTQQLVDMLSRVKSSTSFESRKSFMEAYNGLWSPLLKTEDASMQILAQQLVYMHQPRGESLPMSFGVSRTLDNDRESSYPSRATMRVLAHDDVYGLKARVIEPHPDEGAAHNRVVIAFVGTGGSDAMNKQRGYATGIAADLDANGIGHTAFRKNAEALTQCVRENLAAGRPVTLTGHSLGGAYAARLMAELSPEEQKNVRLITFAAPHLDAATADKVVGGKSQVHCWQTVGDWVPTAGEKAVDGRYFAVQGRGAMAVKKNHGDLQLADAELQVGHLQELSYTESDSPIVAPNAAHETVRRFGRGLHRGSQEQAPKRAEERSLLDGGSDSE